MKTYRPEGTTQNVVRCLNPAKCTVLKVKGGESQVGIILEP